MHRLFPLFLMPLLLGGLAAPLSTHAAGNLTQNSSRECAICHFRWMDQFVQGRGTLLAPLEIEDVAGVEMMCLSCHDGSNQDSRSKVWLLDMHKTGIVPSDKVTIPKLFPLSHDGTMVCATCHSAHSNPTDTSIERSVFLRTVNNDSIMCEMCHVTQQDKVHNHPLHEGKSTLPEIIYDAGGIRSVKDPNHLICESCHTAHGGVERNLILPVTDSVLCAVCHGDKIDDTSAPPSQQKNHPLFVEYKPSPSHEKAPGGDPKSILQCLSCHKVHEHEDGTKALVTAKDPLCSYCHSEKEDLDSAPASGKKNHPLSVTFKLAAEDAIILEPGPNGTVRCYTCHKVHGHEPGTRGLAAKRDELCAACHVQQSFVTGTDHDLGVTAPNTINAAGQNVQQAGICSPCHIPHNVAGPALSARHTVNYSDEHSAICISCHQEKGPAQNKTVGKHSHPVGVATKDTTLPLFEKNNDATVMACQTCHNPHQWQPGLRQKGKGNNLEGNTGNSFLRKPAGADPALCASCHPNHYLIEGTDHDLTVTAQEKTNISRQKVQQSGVCSACHIPHNAAGRSLWASNTLPLNASPSVLCLSCHHKDGVAAKKTTGQHSHPVNVVADSQSLPLYTRGDKKKVMECSTCHNPHRWGGQSNKKGKGINIEGDGDNSFLRAKTLRKPLLCKNCHQQKALVSGTDHDMRITAPSSGTLRGEKASEGSVCNPCHSIHNAPEKILLWNAPLAVEGLDFMEMACKGCHSQSRAGKDKIITSGTHPRQIYFGYHKSYRDILFSMEPMQDPIPLYSDVGIQSLKGEITCPTCHNAHVWNAQTDYKHEENPEGTIVDSFLRKGARNDLCYACHGRKTLMLYRYFHDANKTKRILGHSTVKRQLTAMDKTMDKRIINPHSNQPLCLSCHSSTPVKGQPNLAEGGDINALCNRCHATGGARKDIHPVGIIPSKRVRIPPDMPLQNGLLTCETCHHSALQPGNPCQSAEGKKENKNFLRVGGLSRSEFCFLCHVKETYKRLNPHIQVGEGEKIKEETCLFCHTTRPDLNILGPGQVVFLVDNINELCMGCHPGFGTKHPSGANHLIEPKGIILRGLETSIERIGVELPLHKGKIVCATCHNPHQNGVIQINAAAEGSQRKNKLRLLPGIIQCTGCHWDK